MQEKAAPKLVNSTTIAQIFGVSTQWVQTLTRNGIIHAVSRQGGYKYDLLPTIQRYIAHLTEKAESKSKTSGISEDEGRKLAAEADLKRSKAEMAALQLRELEKKMIPSETVADAMDDYIDTIRREIEALPDTIPPKLVGVSSAAEASQIIQVEVFAALNRLAEYRYEPDKKKTNEQEEKR